MLYTLNYLVPKTRSVIAPPVLSTTARILGPLRRSFQTLEGIRNSEWRLIAMATVYALCINLVFFSEDCSVIDGCSQSTQEVSHEFVVDVCRKF